MDYKADARRRFESHRAASRRHGGRGRGRGARQHARDDDGGDFVENTTTTSELFNEDNSTTRARREDEGGVTSGVGVSDDDEYERAMTRGADLESLLRDASLACLPRQNRDSTYFDVNWTIDALRNIERDLGVDSDGGDVAGALAIDCNKLAKHLEAASLAQLLGLPKEYEVECGFDGQPGVAPARLMHAVSVVPAAKAVAKIDVSVHTQPTSGAVPPRKTVAADDWLDELLDE